MVLAVSRYKVRTQHWMTCLLQSRRNLSTDLRCIFLSHLYPELYLGLLVMAALWNRAGHYIFALLFLLSFFLLFFLALSQPSQIGCLPYFHTWRGLSAKLRCRSESCCTRPAENIGCKKVAKNRHLGTIAQLATWQQSGTCFQTNSETPTALSLHSNSHWRHSSLTSISVL